MFPTASLLRAAVAACMLCAGTSGAATAPDMLAGYAAQAARPADPGRGRLLFVNRHGRQWACASCHGAIPTGPGEHAATGKPIAPLAPAFNPKRFTDAARTEKWFRRNCRDVVGRECTAAEKADVLAWLITLKP